MKTNQNTIFEDRLSPKGPVVRDLSVAIPDQLRDYPLVPSDPLVRQQEQHRVAIVGPGAVGATTAYALLMSGVAEEIVLVGRNRARTEGHAADLRHAEPFSRTTRIWAGNYADCATAAVIVIAAGVSQRSTRCRDSTTSPKARRSSGASSWRSPRTIRPGSCLSPPIPSMSSLTRLGAEVRCCDSVKARGAFSPQSSGAAFSPPLEALKAKDVSQARSVQHSSASQSVLKELP
jgi:lactate/malate dehydrogenase, NAD binding domain